MTPKRRPAVFGLLEQICEVSHKAHQELSDLSKRMDAMSEEELGPLNGLDDCLDSRLYEILYLLGELELTVVEIVAGKVTGKEDRFEACERRELATREAMGRVLSYNEQVVYQRLVVEEGSSTQQDVAGELGISQSRVSQLARSAKLKMAKQIGWQPFSFGEYEGT
jgi:DNA-directed RNA polymerase specialized sigma subunit